MIRHLDLSDNQLAGSIPDSIGHLKSLQYVCGMLCRDCVDANVADPGKAVCSGEVR